MEFSRQEYWSGLPFPPPGDFPDPGMESGSPTSQAGSLPSEPPGKPHINIYHKLFLGYLDRFQHDTFSTVYPVYPHTDLTINN